MLAAATSVMVIASLSAIFLSAKFRRSLRRESPQLYEKLVAKRRGRSFLDKPPLHLAAMMLFRSYRSELADCPASRAWASWISAADWIMVAAMAVAVVSVVSGRGA